ncbi:hypothetical protein CAEBREN_05639 [Caenorhabditis brenneri]|uniref:Uncharacterized protein n=1 Tax=Caenorhabditis brenneri TaxID=135651 RepID=G0N7H3_CAEBE|nr:hypothetical protein CAEBREN_05639 [Caenorhabditis brenneri]
MDADDSELGKSKEVARRIFFSHCQNANPAEID